MGNNELLTYCIAMLKESHSQRISYVATQSAKILLAFSCSNANLSASRGHLATEVCSALYAQHNLRYVSLCDTLTETAVSSLCELRRFLANDTKI